MKTIRFFSLNIIKTLSVSTSFSKIKKNYWKMNITIKIYKKVYLNNLLKKKKLLIPDQLK